ncbi:MAG: Smr/MutS family protein, partial [Pseudomonadota bacterium]
DRLVALDDVWGPIDDSFEEDGTLADHASNDLARLRHQAAAIHAKLGQEMRRLLETPQIAKFLQDQFYTQRENRYVLPVRADAGPAIDGIVLGSSSSGATIFVEPREIVELNNELKVAELGVRREEIRILTELSELVQEEQHNIKNNQKIVTELDLINARARLAIQMQAYKPKLSEDWSLLLHKLRHPLMTLTETYVVANDLELGPHQCLIISGPNAGGKTVCLKAIGLCALMVRSGMHLPASEGSSIPLYSSVLAEIGDKQSIEQNLSTFTAHVQQLLILLQMANESTLILVDEVVTGTDPSEGQALAQALLESFAGTRTHLVVTTHYDGLKALPLMDSRFTNASVGFDLERLMPSFAIHLGVPGSSCALAVASQLGLPKPINERAKEFLDQDERKLAALLTQLSDELHQLQEQKRLANQAEESARNKENELQKKIAELKSQGRKAVAQAYDESLQELKQARAELEQVRALLRRPIDTARAKQADRQISKSAQRIKKHEPHPVPPEGRPANEHDLTPGIKVFVPHLGGIGEVLEPASKGRVSVRIGGLRSQIAIDQVLVPSKPIRKNVKNANSESPKKGEPVLTPHIGNESRTDSHLNAIRQNDITLDARGMRVDEALSAVEKFIDQALLQEEPVLFILHGHGTGALKSAIRSHLGELDLVKGMRPGKPEEGGDGITVLWLT